MDKNTETIPIPIDLQELREVTRQGATRMRAQVPDIIRFWRNVVTVLARRAWSAYGYDTFLLYCAGDLELRSKTYIDDCLHIARLDPLRFDGCILNMDALICAARHLGEAAQRTLAEAARNPILKGTVVTAAVEKVYKLDDAAAAMYLRAWLIDGKDMKFSEDDEARGAPPPPQSATSVCRSLCAAMLEVYRLHLLLDKRVGEGDEPAPKVVSELLALLQDHPRVGELVLETLQTLPPPTPAPPKKGERRQRGRSAEAKTTPETKVDAAAGAAMGDAQAGGTVVVEQTTAQTTVVNPVAQGAS